MKKLLIGFGIVLIALVVAVVAVLLSTDFNQYRGLIAEQAKAATGRDLVIAGNLDLNISLSPSLSVEGVSFANAAWGTRPEMVKLDRVEAEVQLLPLIKGEIRVNRVLVTGLDVLLETDKSGRPNWLFGAPGQAKPDAAATKEGAPPIPQVRELRIEKVKLTYRDGPKGSKTEVVIDSLDLAADGLDAPLRIQAAGSFNGLAYGAQGELGALGRLGAGTPYPVRLKARLAGAVLGVRGEIAKPLAGKGLGLGIDLKTANLAATLKQAAALAPGLKDAGPVPSVPLSFKARLTDPKSGYALDGLALSLGGNDLAGRLEIGLGGQRPRLKADLTSRLLDLDSLLAGGEKKPAPAPASRPAAGRKKDDGRVFPADPLPLDGLRAIDAAIKFQGKLLRVNKMAISDLGLDLRLADGRLGVKPFKAVFGGGLIGGWLDLDGRGKSARLEASLKIDHLDYGALLKQLSITDIATGKLDLATEIRGSGASLRALMAGLNGRLRLTSENGRINSTLLNIISADIFAAASPFSQSKGDKDLRCAVIHFDIKSGQAGARALLIETGGISLLGKGGLDLAAERIDLKFDPRSKKANLIKAVIPFSVGGTFAAPSVVPDAGAVAKKVAKAAAGIATGGLTSVLGGIGEATGVTDDGIDETDYCALALAGKPMVRAQKKKPRQSAAPPPPPAGEKKSDTGVKGTVEGLGKTLKGLFGN